MIYSIRLSVILIAALGLVSCIAPDTKNALRLHPPPHTVTITVTKAEDCSSGEDITAKTTTQTCPFGPTDPPGVACQKPSDNANSNIRKLNWNHDGEEEFTLVFADGNPFKNTNGQCRIDTPSKSFTCRIDNNPTKYDYKYDIVFSDSCRQDPRIYIVR